MAVPVGSGMGMVRRAARPERESMRVNCCLLVDGHGGHRGKGGVNEAAVVTVGDEGGWEDSMEARDGEGEGDGRTGQGDDQARAL